MPRKKSTPDAEVAALKASVKQLGESMKELTNLVTTLATAKPVPAVSEPSPMETIKALDTPGEINMSSTRDLRTGKAIKGLYRSGDMVRVAKASPKFAKLDKATEGNIPVGEVIRLMFCDEHRKYLVHVPGIGDDGFAEEELVRA